MWIKTIPESEAAGLLKKEYDDAVRRSGRVSPVVRSMSVNPSVLNAGMKRSDTCENGG